MRFRDKTSFRCNWILSYFLVHRSLPLNNSIRNYLLFVATVNVSRYLNGLDKVRSFASNTRCKGSAPWTPLPSGPFPVAIIEVATGKELSLSSTDNEP